VKGYAFSGAGAKIYRVDVSADGGKSWVEAELDQQGMDKESRNWAWTLWKAKVPVDKNEKKIEIVAKVKNEILHLLF
jgi:sulfite oxidase